MTLPVPSHSKLSFSARSRWAICPVSVPLSVGMPDKPSPAAAEGTAAHTVAETIVSAHFNLTEKPYVSRPQFPEGFDPKGQTWGDWCDDLIRHGVGYRDFIVSLIGSAADAYIVLEYKVAAPSIHEQLFGTADCLIWIASTRTLIVVDYKYGFAGVDVGTVEAPNKQLEAYAIAAIEQTGVSPERVLLAVYQPRRHLGAPGAVLELPGAWLEGARATLAREAKAVEHASFADGRNKVAPVPGDHCRYCRAKSRCGVVNQFAAAALKAYAVPTSLHDMTDDEVVALWSMRTAFKNFQEDIEERVAALFKSGHGGLTVKTAQGRQMWINAKDAALTLLALGRSDLVQACALSDALHAIPADARESLVKRSAPSQTIVPVTKANPGDVALIFEKYANKS